LFFAIPDETGTLTAFEIESRIASVTKRRAVIKAMDIASLNASGVPDRRGGRGAESIRTQAVIG
jgi:hypothetical protein